VDRTGPHVTETDPSRRVTIRDVATATGVAPSTVSRALSLPDRVNPATQQRIQRAARDLGYVPNSQARALTSGRTRAVAVLVSDITNPFYFDVIRGTQHQLSAAGWTQLLVDTEESADAEMAALSAVAAKADGVVLTASRLSDAQIAKFADRTPLVVVNRRPAGVPSVLIDTPGGVEQAVQHLVSLGPATSSTSPGRTARGRTNAAGAPWCGSRSAWTSASPGSARTPPSSTPAPPRPTPPCTPGRRRASRSTTSSRSACSVGSGNAGSACPRT
jgi:hypothetical protein